MKCFQLITDFGAGFVSLQNRSSALLVRAQAARCVLEFATQSLETEDLLLRIERLEENEKKGQST